MAGSETFVVELPIDLAQFVHAQVGRGALHSEADVVREALRLAAQDDAYMDQIRRDIAAGMAALKLSGSVDGEAFMEELDSALEKLERHQL